MGRLVWDKPSVTIRTEFFKPEKGRYLHPDEHRPITHFEAARIQGFADDYPLVRQQDQHCSTDRECGAGRPGRGTCETSGQRIDEFSSDPGAYRRQGESDLSVGVACRGARTASNVSGVVSRSIVTEATVDVISAVEQACLAGADASHAGWRVRARAAGAHADR